VFFTFNHINKNKTTEVCLSHVRKTLVNSYTTYCNFLLEANINEQLITQGENNYTLHFNALIDELKDTISYISNSKHLLKKLEKNGIKDSLVNAMGNYKETFHYLALSIQERGIKSIGNLQSLQEISNSILQQLASSKNTELNLSAIKLQNLESEFLFYSDQKAYYDILSLLDDILNNSSPEKDAQLYNEKLISLIDSYRSKIQYLNNVLLRIGTQDQAGGLLSEFDDDYQKLTYTFNRFESVSLQKIKNLNRWWITGSVIACIIFTLFYIYLIWMLLIKIKYPLFEALDYSYHLSKGKLLPKDLPLNVPYEFSTLNSHLNRINAFVKDKKIFVDNLLKQRFDIDLLLQGKNDTFGKTLLALKENMKKAREEQLAYAEENKFRRYLNEGIAKFADILRSNSDNLSNLSDVFISELVKYLNAIQGGLFLAIEKNDNEFHLVSAFAYNRKRYLNKTIAIGEGLVGACAIEKKSINLTEIPEEYIEITSGLGEAPPNNLLLLPVMHDETLIGVIELASLKQFEAHQIEIGENIASILATTIIATRNNAQTSELLTKSQQQAAEMAEQEEEMRQNMEELKATQEESLRREEDLESVLNTLNRSFYIIEYDTKGIVCKANEKILSLLNLTTDKVLGKSHAELFGKGSKADSLLFDKVSEGNIVELNEKLKINNRPLELNYTFSPIQSKAGKILRILNIMSVNY
jgi:PAS domain-containing protein